MMNWLFFTIAAVTLQTFRNLEQKALNKKLDELTVSWSRFILPIPLSIIAIVLTFCQASEAFIFFCIITAIAQIGGNVFLLKTIKSKNFSIGIAFYKTEVLQTMLLGFILFNQVVSNIGILAVIVTTLGMILMSSFKVSRDFKFDYASFCGAVSGLFFAISAFTLKFAAQEMIFSGNSAIKASVIVLLWVIAVQNIIFIVIKLYQKRLIADLTKLFSLENKSSFFKMGCLSFAGSICWFAAYTLGNVLYVKVVGQLELIFAVIASQSYLREKHSFREMVGIALTLAGILILLVLS